MKTGKNRAIELARDRMQAARTRATRRYNATLARHIEAADGNGGCEKGKLGDSDYMIRIAESVFGIKK